jgi:excisionase family DNA binding protein
MKLTNRKMKLTNRKAGTPKRRMTEERFDKAKSSFHHAAKCFNVSYGTIKKLVEVNKITCNKIGHRYFIPVTSLRDYLTSTD